MSHDSGEASNAAKGRVGTGGAATTTGIWYQALWILLQASVARFDDVHGSTETDVDGLRLVLEPHGGDVVLAGQAGRRVVQLKTRGTGTWSLKEVIEEVFPDLYRAVDLSEKNTTYEFVTEGRRGQWEEVERFFHDLATLLPDPSSKADFERAYARLDNQKSLGFRGLESVSPGTRRQVFDHIVNTLRTSSEPVDLLCRKAWHLLSRFRFVGEKTEAEVRKDLDRVLLTVIERREDLSTVRQGMVAWLIEKSKANNTEVTPKELFEHFRLGHAVPACHLAQIRARSEEQARKTVRAWGYRADLDVRPSGGLPDAAVVAITGESGDGKTWRLCAEALSADTPAVVVLSSSGSARDDLRCAAERVWQSVMGHDGSLSLENIHRRIVNATGLPRESPWLTICLDELSDVSAAKAFLNEPLADCGVRLVVACDPLVAQIFEQRRRNFHGSTEVVHLGRFGAGERDQYLQKRLGERWLDVPTDVRTLLRKPRLANIYCDLATDVPETTGEPFKWSPRNEYELIQRYWERILHEESAEHPLDVAHVRSLAALVLDREVYPWDVEQLAHARVDESCIGRLTRRGWLRRNMEGRYEIPNQRLLNWAVAEVLVVRCRSRAMDAVQLTELLGRMLSGNERFGSIRLGYVPMDWFFLANADKETKASAKDVLTLLYDRLPQHGGELDRKLLPTLEAAAVPLLEERLIGLAKKERWREVNAVIEGLATRPAAELHDRVLALLSHESHLVRRAALRLLARCPLPDTLDVAWGLHNMMQADPSPFRNPGPQVTSYLLYEDSFKALKACVRLAPEWLVTAIQRADSQTERIHDLAYLIANLEDGASIWWKCKAELFAKIPKDKCRALALNIGLWRDIDEMERLERWIVIEQDHLGPAALQAMARIAPLRAAKALQRLPEIEFHVSRGWYLPPLFLRAGEQTRATLHHRIQSSETPLLSAMVYQDYQNELDARTLNLLLDALDQALGELLDTPTTEIRADTSSLAHSWFRPLSLLAAVGRADLLDVFATHAGTRLEERLARTLERVIGPRTTLGQDSLSREPGLRVLLMLGGNCYRSVIGAFLNANSPYGKVDAIEEAQKDAGPDELKTLRTIAVSDELWDDTVPLVQMMAVRTLAAHGDVEGLVSAILRLGLQTPGDICEWLRPGTQGSPGVLADIVHTVYARQPKHLHGALLCIGLLRHVAAIDDVIAVLRDTREQDTRSAAIVALGLLGATAATAIDLIGNFLGDKHYRFHAVAALARIGTPEARTRLLRSLSETWDIELAVALAHESDVAEQSIDWLVRKLDHPNETRALGLFSELEVVLAQAEDEVLHKVISRCPSVHDQLREAAFGEAGSFWSVGTKAQAIRGLAAFDPDAAWTAAKKALIHPEEKDRHRYPPLLYRLDAEHAREVFLSVAEQEANRAVLWAMAYSLRQEDLSWVLKQLESDNLRTRGAACRLAAGPLVALKVVEEQLTELFEDQSNQVVQAASEALRHGHRQVRAEALADRLAAIEAPTPRDCWQLAEAALQVGDPGFEETQRPAWLHRFTSDKSFNLLPSVAHLFHDKLKKLRKDALDAAQKR